MDINLVDLNICFNLHFMKTFASFIIVLCLFCSCNNSNSGTYNTTDSIQAEYTSNDSIVNNDTVYDIYGTAQSENISSNANEIVGNWTEYRADDDAYLLGHYLFNADGTGSWVLTGGLENDTDVRNSFNFQWYLDEVGDIVIEDEKGETTVLSYQNGLIISTSTTGNEIYKKDDVK